MVTSGEAPQIRRRRIDPLESSPRRTPPFVREEYLC